MKYLIILTKFLKIKKNFSNLKENYKKILIVMSPVIPHLANECLDLIGLENYDWPKVKKEFLQTDEREIVIQINGKKEGI